MQKAVFLYLHFTESAIKRDAQIENKTDEPNQKQWQDKFHHARMPVTHNAVHSRRAADIGDKRQSAADRKYKCQYSARPGKEIVFPQFHSAYLHNCHVRIKPIHSYIYRPSFFFPYSYHTIICLPHAIKTKYDDILIFKGNTNKRSFLTIF